MSEDFLKNPLSLFDIRGKTAIVTGASGAFGALAAKVLAGAGCNLVLAAGGQEALKQVAAECEKLGAKTLVLQCDVADECLQLFGGYGYMQEYPISRMYTDSRIQKIYGGTNEIMKEIISRFL